MKKCPLLTFCPFSPHNVFFTSRHKLHHLTEIKFIVGKQFQNIPFSISTLSHMVPRKETILAARFSPFSGQQGSSVVCVYWKDSFVCAGVRNICPGALSAIT